ncbi:MAG: hypothetical protein WC053_02460 [Sideroxydans sp.]|jgi:hypothetical protein
MKKFVLLISFLCASAVGFNASAAAPTGAAAGAMVSETVILTATAVAVVAAGSSVGVFDSGTPGTR